MKLKKLFLWFFMLSKRLLLRRSFVILIISIPLIVAGVNLAMKGDSGILTIHLCAGKDNPGADEVIEYILNQKTSILFKKSPSLDASLKALDEQSADAVWYFKEDFNEKTDDYSKGKYKRSLVKVFEREDTIPLKLSREKLFGGVFSKLSYSLYRNFVYSEFVKEDVAGEDVVKSYIGKRGEKSDVVIMETIDGKVIDSDESYLVAPLRGLLSLFIMLCGFAAAILFVEDRKNGKFDWMSKNRQIIPAFAQCLSGTVIASFAVFFSLYFTGGFTSGLKEVVLLLLFSVSTALFCLNLCMIFKSGAKLMAIVPALVIGVLALSPVFFDIKVLNGVKLLLPTHYYLYSVHDISYLSEFLKYIACAYAVSVLLTKIRSIRGC